MKANLCLVIVLLILVQQCAALKYRQSSGSIPMSTLQKSFDKIFATQCKYFPYLSVYESNVKNVKNAAGTGGFDMKVPLQQVFGIQSVAYNQFYQNKKYEFPNSAKNGYFNTSSIIYYPEVTTPSILKGVVAYFHPTLFAKDQSPSSNQTPAFLALVGLYVSRGYAVVMADQVGISVDYANAHPYVFFPQQNIRSTVYALNEGEQFLLKAGFQPPFKLFSTGYSEGGAYGIWMHKCLSARACPYFSCDDNLKLSQNYKFSGAAGLEGAYDLVNVTKSFLVEQVGKEFDNNKYNVENTAVVNFVKPNLAAIAMDSYCEYGKDAPTLQNMLNPQFYSMNCQDQSKCNYDGQHLTVQQLVRLQKAQNAKFVLALGNGANSKTLDQYQYADNYLTSYKNSAYALVHKEYIQSDSFNKLLKEADISDYGGQTHTPLLVFSLVRDSVVSVNNYHNFMRNANENVKGYTFENELFNTCLGIPMVIDHITAEVLANVFALDFFNGIVGKSQSKRRRNWQ